MSFHQTMNEKKPQNQLHQLPIQKQLTSEINDTDHQYNFEVPEQAYNNLPSLENQNFYRVSHPQQRETCTRFS